MTDHSMNLHTRAGVSTWQVRTGFDTVCCVLCECNKAKCTVDRVETYLFYGRDRRRVLPGRAYCNLWVTALRTRSRSFSLNRCTVAIYSLYSRTIRISRTVQKPCNLLRFAFRRDRTTAIEQNHATTYCDLKSPKILVSRSSMRSKNNRGLTCCCDQRRYGTSRTLSEMLSAKTFIKTRKDPLHTSTRTDRKRWGIRWQSCIRTGCWRCTEWPSDRLHRSPHPLMWCSCSCKRPVRSSSVGRHSNETCST